MRKAVFSAAVLLWMAVIFLFSAKPADESADMSRSAGQWIGKTFVGEYRTWTKEKQEAFAEAIDYPVRKAAHAAEYAVLGMLLAGMIGSFNASGWKRWGASYLIGTCYAATDEFHQLFVPGRSGQVSDVMLDSAGVLAGVLIYLLLRIIFHRMTSRR